MNILFISLFSPLKMLLVTFLTLLIILLFSPPDIEKPNQKYKRLQNIFGVLIFIFGGLFVLFTLWSIFYYIKI